jgi:lysyl-tRNA synthetase class 2
MVSRYPRLLPSLARKVPDDDRWVERVELFLGGMELGNGFHELTDPVEQEQRFVSDLEVRKLEGLSLPDMDERLIEALRLGLPDCSGIAVGLDRLLMVLTRTSRIEDVLAFPFLQA